MMRLRIGLAVALFAAWMGWLIYLALADSHLHSLTDGPIRFDRLVLSRPQFMVSSLDVVAHIEKLDGPVVIKDVLWPKGDELKLQGKTLSVTNLANCEQSWAEPGDYIVPLMPDPKGGYQVAPIPPSPGSPPRQETKDGLHAYLPVRIYPDRPETRQQVYDIPKPGANRVSAPAE
jgi:hypothetical protein